MIIAPDFVFVHLSKTGGTFAAEALRALFCPNALDRKIHRLRTRHGIRLPRYKYLYDEGEQHGLCNDIPRDVLDRAIISCIRNPFDLYVSEYTFEWWKRFPAKWFYNFSAFEAQHPEWRKFSFQDFVLVSHMHASWVQRTLVKFPQAEHLGWYTHKFVYYYCRDHDYVFEAAQDFERFYQRVRESLYPVRFIHTDRLNDELCEFLLSRGYQKERIERIRVGEKINSSRADHNWREWYSDGLKREVERRDELIFRLFPEFCF